MGKKRPDLPEEPRPEGLVQEGGGLQVMKVLKRELVYALHLTLDAAKGVPIPKKSKASSKTKLLGQNPGHRCIKKGQTPRSRRAHILASASD